MLPASTTAPSDGSRMTTSGGVLPTTISVTVGLPILRTSVDHGTAFDIAGSGKAGHGTMLSAYLAAVDYAPYGDAIRATYGA